MESILIVDDEPELVEIISIALQNKGWEITGTTKPTEAIELIKNNHFNLVITDLKMPEIDGLILTESVKKYSPSTDVVVITGYGSLDTAVDALKHNVYDYLLKPINIDNIILTVNRIFDKQHLEKENKELQERIEKSLGDITTLYEMSKFLNSSQSLDQVLHFTADIISESIGVDIYTIMLKNEDSQLFEIKKSVGLEEYTNENFVIKYKKGIIGGAINGEDYIFVQNYSDDENYIKNIDEKDKPNITSFCIVPLRFQDQVIGLLTVHGLDVNSAEDVDKLKLLSVIATQLSPVVQFTLYHSENAILARDPIHLVRKEMNSILEKAIYYKGELIFLIFKLYLKRPNPKATTILSLHHSILLKLRQQVSLIDSVITLGLDSFVVILQGKSKMSTEIFASKVKEDIEKNILFKDETGFLLDYGYATFPIDGSTAEELIAKAQFNLWEAAKARS